MWYRRIVLAAIVILFLSAGWSIVDAYAPELLAGLPIPQQLVTAVLSVTGTITLVVGMIRARAIAKQSPAFSTLAHELSQVSNQSDIVINAIGDGVVALDNYGVVQLINPAAQNALGWSAADAVGLDYRSVFKLSNATGEAVDEAANPIGQALNGQGSVTTNDLIITTNSGKKMNVSLLISPIGQDGNGGAIVVFRDITHEISENQQRAEFVSTASHEMRTPVAAIEGYLGLALNPQTAAIDDKARAYITKAHEAAQHLGRLFQDLLDVSKAEDGRLKNAPVVTELVGFMRDTVSLLEPRAAEKGLQLVFAPDRPRDSQTITPIFYADVDPDHLREVITNLVENGIKYTKEGSVTVDITGSESKVQVNITDSGIGIAREDIPHLFQKFYRVDNTDTREIGGTGLGLYLCRRLVESMDGRIWVESERGSGSTFSVEFDRLSSEEAERRRNVQMVVPEQPPQ